MQKGISDKRRDTNTSPLSMTENKLPKVLLGGLVSDYHDYCTDRFIESIKKITYPNCDTLFIDNSKSEDFYNRIKDKLPVMRGKYFPSIYDRLIHNRNILRQKALDEGYDYLLNVDQDIILPRNAIEVLLSHGKEIISGLYFNPIKRGDNLKMSPTMWVSFSGDKSRMVPIKDDVALGSYMIEIASCGSGCLMIHRNVLEKVKFRYDLNEGPGVDDVFFCADAKKAGFKIYADTAVKCIHMVRGRGWNWEQLMRGEI